MKKLYYNYRNFRNDGTNKFADFPEDYVGMFLERATPKTSEYLSGLDAMTEKFKTFKEKVFYNSRLFLKGRIAGETFSREVNPNNSGTIAKCPGVFELLKNCYLIKMPCDVTITLDKNGVVLVPANQELVGGVVHGADQYESRTSNIFKNKINLKIVLPITLSTRKDKDVSAMILPATYHTDNPFTIPTGIISHNYLGYKEQLNIQTFFDKVTGNEVKEYFIAKGTVLGYLWLTEPTELVYDSTLTEDPFRTRFSRMSKVKDVFS